jgi:DeoR/GlpR family transcriptional regulator of sugar metabolism
MPPKKRHEQILEMLRSGSCSVAELADALNCSPMTIRRDLNLLESQNLVKRMHGSAELVPNNSTHIMNVDPASLINKKEKEAVAVAAQIFIKPNSIIAVDSGSSAHAVVRNINQTIPLTVITPNVRNSLYLCGLPYVETIQVGGIVNHRNTSTLDYLAIDFIRKFNVDVSFITTCAILPDGAFEKTITLIDSKKALASVAKKVVLLADYSKFGISALCFCLAIDKIDAIITDNSTPTSAIDNLVAKGKEVVIVDTDTQKIIHHYNRREA